jgi:hypothetical protein
MPFVGIGAPSPMAPAVPPVQASAFDYSMLNPNHGARNRQQQPQEVDPFATLGGAAAGNWSSSNRGGPGGRGGSHGKW